jgi:spermidine synthase
MKVIEEAHSEINGKIIVLRDLVLGTFIRVEGLTQSGSVVYDVWEQTLKEIKKQKPSVKRCLILGLGGGSAAKLVNKFWPDTKICGVDVDPVIVELGKKHMGLEKIPVEIVIAEGEKFINKEVMTTKVYDLILIDMYVGVNVPEEFENLTFVRKIINLTTHDGIAVYNRLYYDTKRVDAVEFAKKLKKSYKGVEPFYPEANVMYICTK